MEFNKLRRAYDLYGFIKLANIFEDWQIEALENSFNKFYEKKTGVNPDHSDERLPALGQILEDPDVCSEVGKIIASNPWLMTSLRAVAGENCQYLGSDVLLVYDDSIGVHRDTYYDYDAVKVLVFLSDCSPTTHGVDTHFRLNTSAGGFAVLSGSHLPGSRYSTLASQISDWPRPEVSVRCDLTSEYHRGDVYQEGEFLYPVRTYDTRYQAFSHIPFKKGDVVIFSTRAFHALLPTHSKHAAKLLGLLFIEDFEKASGRPLSDSVEKIKEDEKEYRTIPYNLRLADCLIKGASYETAFQALINQPMGLVELLSTNDQILNKAFDRHVAIYKNADGDALDIVREHQPSKEEVLKIFERNFHIEHSLLSAYSNSLDMQLRDFKSRSSSCIEDISSLTASVRDNWLTKIKGTQDTSGSSKEISHDQSSKRKPWAKKAISNLVQKIISKMTRTA